MAIDLFDVLGGGIIGSLKEKVQAAAGADAGEKPFPICPKLCLAAPQGCAACAEYEERIQKALSLVEHPEAYEARFQVGGPDVAAEGELVCPVCDGPGALTATECAYCGADLTSAKGCIRVRSKADIPNPALAACQLIQKRQRAVNDAVKSKPRTGGLISGALSYFNATINKMNGVDKDMTLSDIESTAMKYGVSIRSYLEGLDGGKYMTAAGYQAQQALEQAQKAMNESNRQRMAATAQRSAMRQSSGGPLDFMQRHQQSSGSTGYMGKASGSCCGNCRYYLMETNECGNNHFRHPAGASDSCGDYRSK